MHNYTSITLALYAAEDVLTAWGKSLTRAAATSEPRTRVIRPDLREAQTRVAAAAKAGVAPAADDCYSDRSFGAEVAAAAVRAVNEHQRAITRGFGDPATHADAAAAWALVAKTAKRAAGTFERTTALVAAAKQLTEKAVLAK